MKTNSTTGLFIWINIMALSACGGFKVGLDDETADTAECLFNDECDDDSDASDTGDDDDSDSADSDSTDSTDEGDGGSPGEQGEGTNDDDEETGGGVVVVEDYERVDGAYFLGTYQAMDYHYDYYGVADECDYNFPKIIRGYSHDDTIDFETQSGGLAFSAEIYPDETFDFDVRFQNPVGQPTVQVTCTCDIEEGYNDYYPDEIQCGCESSDDNALCLRYWEKL